MRRRRNRTNRDNSNMVGCLGMLECPDGEVKS